MKDLKAILLGVFMIGLFVPHSQAQEKVNKLNSYQGKKGIYAALDSNVFSNLLNGEWKNALKEVYLYTPAGQLWRKEKHLWVAMDSNWALSTVFIYTYNQVGLVDMEAELGRVQSGWDTIQKTRYSYDTSFLPVEERVEKVKTGSQFYTYSTHSFVYNANGQLVMDSLLVSNNQGASFVGNMFEYTYKSNGQLEMKIGWNKPSDSWKKSSKFDYVYTAQNTLALRHYSGYAPATQTWWYSNHAEYDIDSFGNISRMRTFNHSDSLTYTGSVGANGQYNTTIPSTNVFFPYITNLDIPPMTLLEKLTYERYNTSTMVWDTNAQVQFYYTMTITGVEQNAEPVFKIYPNPSSNQVNIETIQEGAHAIKLYAMDGRLLRDLKFDGSHYTLDMIELSQGTYILELSNSAGQFRQKLIKQ